MANVVQNVDDTAAKNQAMQIANTGMNSLHTLSPRDKAFSDAHVRLKTDIGNTITNRYLKIRRQ